MSRWTRLRQYFSKERKRRESNDTTRNPWALFDLMQFISPFIAKKRYLELNLYFIQINCISNNYMYLLNELLQVI